MVVGENGCGKTTLLEAIHLMAQGRSFRQARDPELIRHGERGFRINGIWQRYGPLHVEVRGQRRRTDVCLQGKPIRRRGTLFQALPVIVEAPHARRLVDGVPVERRHWLDNLIMSCGKASTLYQGYFRSVMQRNRLLRKGASAAELDAWEHQIAGHAGKIVRLRESFIAELNTCLAEDEGLTESRLTLHMQTTGPADEEAWLQKLRAWREEDARIGSLRCGPHCDRLRIVYQGREIRTAGSRGQQKLAAMALRLAEQQLRARYRGVVPVLLLDDCLEALDEDRKKRLLVRLERTGAQVLLTGPGMRQPGGMRIERFDLSACGERRLLVPAYAEIEEAA